MKGGDNEGEIRNTKMEEKDIKEEEKRKEGAIGRDIRNRREEENDDEEEEEGNRKERRRKEIKDAR